MAFRPTARSICAGCLTHFPRTSLGDGDDESPEPLPKGGSRKGTMLNAAKSLPAPEIRPKDDHCGRRRRAGRAARRPENEFDFKGGFR
jgi:hypothetical protein